MAYVAVGTFTSNNLAIQGESIQLSFPIATDKNQDTVSYSLQYATQPIYCNTVGGSYICIEDTDSITLSSWENLGPLTGDPTITITRNIPLFSTDVVLKYYIRATDNQLGGGTEPIIESGNIFLIRNTFATLQMSTIDWTAEEDILVNGIISNLGTTRPANYTSIANTGAWSDWRAGIVAALGSTITFTYYYSYSLDNISYSTPALVGSSFDLSYDWLQDRNVALTIDNIEDPPVFSSGNSYYLKIYLVSSLYPEYSSSTLPQLLLNRMPVLNIKKGLLKINMPQKDLGKTGAVMASHGPQQINGTPGEGDSMALYDHHVEVGASEPTNKPSIGFYTTAHEKIAYIRAEKDKGLFMDKIRLVSTATPLLDSTNHAFQIGPDNDRNLRMGPSGLMSINNGAGASLHLNQYGGGNVHFGYTDPVGVFVNGNEVWHAGNAHTNFPSLGANYTSIIPASANMNAYTVPGTYACGSNADALTMINLPITNAFRLYVSFGTTYSETYKIQKIVSYDGGEYRRCTLDGGATWTPWARDWNSENDGAGSGLDADTLDGRHADSFYEIATRHTAVKNSSDSGWCKILSIDADVPYYSPTVIVVEGYSLVSGLEGRTAFELIISVEESNNSTYSCMTCKYLGIGLTSDGFQLRIDTDKIARLFLFIPQYTEYNIITRRIFGTSAIGTHNQLQAPYGAKLVKKTTPLTHKLLWSGSWSSGSITVPSIIYYRTFLFTFGARTVPGAKDANGTSIHAGGMRGISGWIETIHATFNVSGGTLSFGLAVELNHIPSGAHGSTGNLTVTQIYGVA